MADEKKKTDKMSADDFQQLVTSGCTDAVSYIQESIAFTREQATEYYHGKLPDVDKETAEEDRSTAVLTEVRDVTLGMMPDLLRIFFGAGALFKYLPTPSADPEQSKMRVLQAKQATAYVNDVVIRQDNTDSFITFHDAFQDALVRKTGFIKYWWEKSRKPVYWTYTGLSIEQVEMLAGDDEVTIEGKRAYVAQDQILGKAVLYDIKLKRIVDYGKVRIQAVPCENMFVSRRTRLGAIERSAVFGYSEEKTLSQWAELGYNAGELEGCDNDEREAISPEAQARRIPESSSKLIERGSNSASTVDEDKNDPALRKVKYTEVYILADKDGDGIAELNRVVAAGTRYRVMDCEPCDDIQYAAFCPYPEAHVFFGTSIADLTMDLQRIKSRVLRDTLDSLAQSVIPQATVVEGQVNLDDVLNPDTSKIIRMRAPGMYNPHVIPFVGKEGLPIIEMMTNVREGRTGMSDASQGLDPKVLQSTDKAAVSATLTRAQARIEMVARIFAETGMMRLARGILKLIVKHQDEPRTVELTGEVVNIDPKAWNAEMQVQADFPLGRGSAQDQLGFLMSVLAKQEFILTTLGPDNPFVTLEQYHYTLAKILEVAGWTDTGSFFTDPSKMPPEQLEQIKQKMQAAMAAKAGGGAAQGPAAPDPQIEIAKIKAKQETDMATLDFKRQELAATMQMKQIEIDAEMRMRAFETQITRQTTMEQAQIDATVQHTSDMIKSRTAIVVEQLKPRGGADKGG